MLDLKQIKNYIRVKNTTGGTITKYTLINVFENSGVLEFRVANGLNSYGTLYPATHILLEDCLNTESANASDIVKITDTSTIFSGLNKGKIYLNQNGTVDDEILTGEFDLRQEIGLIVSNNEVIINIQKYDINISYLNKQETFTKKKILDLPLEFTNLSSNSETIGSGKTQLYSKTDGLFYYKNNTVENQLGLNVEPIYDIIKFTMETSNTIMRLNTGSSFIYYNSTYSIFEMKTLSSNVDISVGTVVAEQKYYFGYNGTTYDLYSATSYTPYYDYVKKGWYLTEDTTVKILVILKGVTTSTVQWLGGIRHEHPTKMIAINDDNSFTEILTGGYWTNGKPIYSKVIYMGLIGNGKTVAHGVVNGENLSLKKGWAYDGTYYTALPRSMPGSIIYQIDVSFTATIVALATGFDYSSYYAYLIMEYTKTTD